MTYQELIERLLADETDLSDCAVNRIEELVKELDISRMASVVMDNTVEELEAKLVECEARLSKAVDALRLISQMHGYTSRQLSDIARTTLAELEGK